MIIRLLDVQLQRLNQKPVGHMVCFVLNQLKETTHIPSNAAQERIVHSAGKDGK